MTAGFLDALQASALSRYIAGTNHLVTAGLQVVHVLGFVLLLASWLLVALRVYGIIFKGSAVPDIARDAQRLIVLGLLLAVTTGIVMVIGAPNHYCSNPAFQVKAILFAGAVLVQCVTFVYLGRSTVSMPLIRFGVSISALLWFGVSMAGRAIGFV
jgi:hypothetical protein